MQIGNLDVISIKDGMMVGDGSRALPIAERAGFEAHKDYLTRDGRKFSMLGAFLVRTGDRLVLLDAGMGPRRCGPGCGHDHPYDADDIVHYRPLADSDQETEFATFAHNQGMSEADIVKRAQILRRNSSQYGELGQNLARLGVTPGEITDVVVSHLHCDHVGWLSRRGESYFPKADIWVHQADVEFFLQGTPPDDDLFRIMFGVMPIQERMAPVLPQIKTWDRDTTIALGIDVVWMPGHTPGSSIAVLSSGTSRGMILGDVIHCPLELVDDEFAVVHDVHPELAARSRERIKRELEDPNIHSTSTHFPGLRFGRLLTVEGRRDWDWSE